MDSQRTPSPRAIAGSFLMLYLAVFAVSVRLFLNDGIVAPLSIPFMLLSFSGIINALSRRELWKGGEHSSSGVVISRESNGRRRLHVNVSSPLVWRLVAVAVGGCSVLIASWVGLV